MARKPVIPAGHRLLEKSWEVLGSLIRLCVGCGLVGEGGPKSGA